MENAFQLIGALILVLFPLSIVWLIVRVVLDHRKQLRQREEWLEHMRTHDFEWFRKSHSSAIGRDSVKCTKCGCPRIHVRSVLHQTYMREHFCTQCGTTLYYSPEGMAA